MNCRPSFKLKSLGSCLAVLLSLGASTQSMLGQAPVTLIQTSTRAVGTGAAGFSGDFGSDTSLSLTNPSYVILDTLGNLYVSDTGNNCVRKVDLFGNVTTIAGLVVSGQGDTCNTATNATPTTAQGLLQPTGLALDSDNNLYIADSGHNCIRRLGTGTTGTTNLTAVAGTCSTTAALSSTPAPSGMVIDTSNNLYVALQYTDPVAALDVYQVVRQSVIPANSVATNKATQCLVAGNASALVLTTCTGITNSVVLSSPSGLALDANLNVYVADTGNNCVREVVGTTPQSTTIGQCANDGTGTTATAISAPFGITFSKINTLFVSQLNPNNVYKYNSQSTALTLAAGVPGGAQGAYTSANDGASALNINLHAPKGIVFDNTNNFYLADSGNNIVRYLNINYIFSPTPVGNKSVAQPITFIINKPSVNLNITVGPDYTIANNQCTGTFSASAAGSPPNTCQVFVQFAPTRPGTRYSPITVMDTISNTIVATGLQGIGTGSLGAFVPGTVTTLAAGLKSPTAVNTNSAGNAYVLEAGTTPGTADIRIITPSGNSTQFSVAQGTGLVTPSGIASDAAGNWYIVDATQGTVSRFGADGTINTSYITGLISPSAIFVDGFGNLYIAQQGTAHNVIEVYASGLRRVVAGSGTDTAANGVVATNAKFSAPTGLFIDLNGILYISDSTLHRVFAIDTLNLIHLLAGNGTTTTTNASTALGTAIVDPTSITVDAAGDVYIADSSDNKVFSVFATAASGTNISTIIGNGTPGNTGDNGPSTAATVNGPLSVALDGAGDLFIVDSGNNSLREILYPNPTINFGRVAVGSTSPVMTQGFSNFGTISLNLSGPISTTDSHFAVNTASTTCGTAILSGQICAIGYTFTPTTTSAYTAYSNLVSNSYNSPGVITLTANGALPFPISTSNVTTETEVYGSPFPETTTLSPGSGPAVTGTLTYSVGSQTLCTITGNLSPSSTCNAANSGLSVGTYTVTVTYSGDANYAPATFIISLQVTPAPLTVITNNQSRPYGTANPTLTGTISGITNGDTITVSYSTTAVITSAPGSYPITATLTPGATSSLSNYTITNNGGTLTVTANATAVVTVAVNCATRIYGAANPVFTSTVTGALNGDTFTITYSTTATITSPVGSYPITATVSGAATANYTTINVTPCTLSVVAAPTNTTLTSSGSPSLLGNSVTLTATVTAPGSTITPGGIVSFYTGNGATLLGTGTLNASGVATFTTSSLPVGTDALTAVYPASTNFGGSVGTLNQQVTVPTGAFIIAATPSFQLVYGASTTVYNVTVTSTGGFTGPVALTCSGQPTDGACSFASATVQVSTTTPGTTTLSVVNTAADAALKMPAFPGAPQQQNLPVMAGISWPYALSALALLVAAFGLRKRGKNARGLVLMLLLMVGLAAGAIGCGCPPTAYRTYTIVVTGTSVNGGPAAQTTSVQLAVGTH